MLDHSPKPRSVRAPYRTSSVGCSRRPTGASAATSLLKTLWSPFLGGSSSGRRMACKGRISRAGDAPDRIYWGCWGLPAAGDLISSSSRGRRNESIDRTAVLSVRGSGRCIVACMSAVTTGAGADATVRCYLVRIVEYERHLVGVGARPIVSGHLVAA